MPIGMEEAWESPPTSISWSWRQLGAFWRRVAARPVGPGADPRGHVRGGLSSYPGIRCLHGILGWPLRGRVGIPAASWCRSGMSIAPAFPASAWILTKWRSSSSSPLPDHPDAMSAK